MLHDINSRLDSMFDGTEVSRLRAIKVPVGAGRELDIPSALEAWRLHVEKIEQDLELPDSNQSIWGVHDYIAALTLRDFVTAGIEALECELVNKVYPLLAEIDQRFMSYTEDDEIRSLWKIDQTRATSDRWWWRRIPAYGPIRRELDQM